MTEPQLDAWFSGIPFFKFTKLAAIQKKEQARTLLGFDPFLKNHIGTLHAGALFTAAHADAKARVQDVLKTKPNTQIKSFTSQISYKKPAKGPVWVETKLTELSDTAASVHCVLHSQTDEPLGEMTMNFVLDARV